MTYKQKRRAEADWHRRMLSEDLKLDKNHRIQRMSDMFQWCQKWNMGGGVKTSKLAAYVSARRYATGGRMLITFSRLPK